MYSFGGGMQNHPVKEEEETELLNQSSGEKFFSVNNPLRCRSVRIGSLRVHPSTNSSSLDVILAPGRMSFTAPKVTDRNKFVNVVLKSADITKMLVHFGRCLHLVFIFTTPTFAERLRKSIKMDPGPIYFDPTSKDEKLNKITLLVDSVNEEQRRFLCSFFLPEQKVWELDQTAAHEILVKSTPNTPVRSDVLTPASQPLTQFAVQSELTVTPITVKQEPPSPTPCPSSELPGPSGLCEPPTSNPAGPSIQPPGPSGLCGQPCTSNQPTSPDSPPPTSRNEERFRLSADPQQVQGSPHPQRNSGRPIRARENRRDRRVRLGNALEAAHLVEEQMSRNTNALERIAGSLESIAALSDSLLCIATSLRILSGRETS